MGITVSSTDGVSDGTNTYKYTLPSDVVQDSNYKHITITNSTTKSITDGTNTLTFGGNAFNSTAIPTSYISSASASGNTLTLTPNSGSAITFTPTFTESHVGDVVSVGATSGSHISIGGTTANPTVGVASGYSIPSVIDQQN